MNRVQARKMVMASIGVLAVIALYRDRTGRGETNAQSTYRTLWGVGVVGIMLSLLADFVPQIAGPFAGLVVLGSLTSGGDKVIQSVLDALAVSPGKGSAAPPATSPETGAGGATTGTGGDEGGEGGGGGGGGAN